MAMAHDAGIIPPSTPYVVVDGQTGEVVYRTTYARRNAARRYADRRDLEYGAHRYGTRLDEVTP
jgi:hypothetical protein